MLNFFGILSSIPYLAAGWFGCVVMFALWGMDHGGRGRRNFGRLTRATFCVLAAAMTVATFKGGAKLRSPNGEATSCRFANEGDGEANESPEGDDVAAIWAIAVDSGTASASNEAGVHLTLHRPAAGSDSVEAVTLCACTDLAEGDWFALGNAVFDAGTTNLDVYIPATQLADNSISNRCFFTFITCGDGDADGLFDWYERFVVGTDPDDTDTDGDGVSDAREIEYGSNPLMADTDGDGLSDGEELAVGSSPISPDTDGDGIADADELELGTFPDLADSDDDGIDDDDEVELGTDPTNEDTDGDGLSDGDELDAGTDPLDPDTDGDGLLDGDEIARGTSPLLNDTDGDGMPDAWEVRYGLLPNWADSYLDSDHDGLTNLQEYQLGLSPTSADTDEDGISDYHELYRDHTDPLLADSDGDGLDDGYEVLNRLSPTSADTDGDGLPDGWEVRYGLNPHESQGDNGGGGDADHDGIDNARELALGTNPSAMDTDGDGLDDGDELGCLRMQQSVPYGFVFWAEAGSNGWTEVETSDGSGFDGVSFTFGEPQRLHGEEMGGVRCQWNGVLLLGAGEMIPTQQAPNVPVDLSAGAVTGAALVVAPLWRARADDDPEPNVTVLRRGSGNCPQYAVRYDNYPVSPTNLVSFQVTFSFTNGVFRRADICYAPLDEGLQGMPAWMTMSASVGVRDNLWDRGYSYVYCNPGGLSTRKCLQFFPGVGTDPLVADTDRDGFSDGNELALGTDPFQPDTDGDTLTDGWEARYAYLGFDPLVACATNSANHAGLDDDMDNDGLTNREECMWNTDPNVADTDGDGVPDGVEVGVVPREDRSGSSPRLMAPTASDPGYSDPTDPSDHGEPGSRVKVVLRFGDPSGSHSEKYRLDVSCVSGAGASTSRINQGYGACESIPIMLVPGAVYDLRLSHVGTDPQYNDTPKPDCDYELVVEEAPQGVYVYDPSGLLGTYDVTDGRFLGAGKVARLYVRNNAAGGQGGGQGVGPGDGGQGGGQEGGGGEGGVEAETPWPPEPPETWPPEEEETEGGGGCFTMPTLKVMFDDKEEQVVGSGEAATPVKLSIVACGGGRPATMRITAQGLDNLVDVDGGGTVTLPNQNQSLAAWNYYVKEVSFTGRVAGVVSVTCSLTPAGHETCIERKAKLYVLGEPRLVFDYDRNGEIDGSDAAKARDGHTTFRFWINDDSDVGDICPTRQYAYDRPEGGWVADCNYPAVDGRRDLVDFTPVWIDLSDVFPSGIPDKYRKIEWVLRSPCVNAVWTSLQREEAGSFQRMEVADVGFGNSLAMRAHRAGTAKLTEGVALADTLFGRRLGKDGRDAVFLVEGTKAGTELSIDGTLSVGGTSRKVAQGQARMNISSVTDMYRCMNVRSVVDPNDVGERIGSPSNWSDSERQGKGHIVLVHGFNVNPDEAEATAAETFKRLWQSGFDGAFTAVKWYGDEGQVNTWTEKFGTMTPLYYANVIHAFATAPVVAQRLNGLLTGESKTVIAHSLGNVLVSSAIKDHGLQCVRYYMLDAAVAMEAYDASAHEAGMIDNAWTSIPERFRAWGWHTLFDGTAFDGDLRRELSWRGRFAGIADNVDVVNCYAESEDVVGNYNLSSGKPLSAFMFSSNTVWVLQEGLKGNFVANGLGAWPVAGDRTPIDSEGGWGVNLHYAWNPLWYNAVTGFDANWVNGLADTNVIVHPLFTPFKIEADSMHNPTNVFIGAGETHGQLSHREWLRARFLADAIPAESRAAGANAFEISSIVNVRLDSEACWSDNDKWPRKDKHRNSVWNHNDFKQVAYFFVYRLFDEFAGTKERTCPSNE